MTSSIDNQSASSRRNGGVTDATPSDGGEKRATDDHKSAQPSTGTAKPVPTWFWVLFGFAMLIIIAGIIFSLYLRYMRFKLAKKALETNNPRTAAAFMAPEIAGGIGSGIGALVGAAQ